MFSVISFSEEYHLKIMHFHFLTFLRTYFNGKAYIKGKAYVNITLKNHNSMSYSCANTVDRKFHYKIIDVNLHIDMYLRSHDLLLRYKFVAQ